jgi:Ni,Fe-hydrogenase I cytochrome b subunit
MISVEGAGVIAQVVPVGLLVLAFEARREDALVGTGRLTEWLVAISRYVLVGTVIAAGTVETVCIMAVSSGSAIRGFASGFVYVVGYVLLFAVLVTVLVAVMRNSGFTDAMIERQMRKPLVRARIEAAVEREQQRRSES